MRILLTIITALGLSMLAGCNGSTGAKKPVAEKKQISGAENVYLTVDFQQGQTLKYKFTSRRDIEINFKKKKSKSRAKEDAVQKLSESMEMVIVYKPVDVQPYGLMTIEATCKSVKVKRSKGPRKDAVEHLSGKSFTFTIDATGEMKDRSQLGELIREAGKKAFRQDKKQRIKEPDMLQDFIASQWFLWDSISSIGLENALKGISLGQSWNSELPIPTSMILKKARQVCYKLKEIRPSEKGTLAVIHSSYSPVKSKHRNWPMPYTGRFQLAGPLGFYRTFFRGFKIKSLQGQGQELFNIDAGQIERYTQNYKVKLRPSVSTLLSDKPLFTINQKLTMQLLENK